MGSGAQTEGGPLVGPGTQHRAGTQAAILGHRCAPLPSGTPDTQEVLIASLVRHSSGKLEESYVHILHYHWPLLQTGGQKQNEDFSVNVTGVNYSPAPHWLFRTPPYTISIQGSPVLAPSSCLKDPLGEKETSKSSRRMCLNSRCCQLTGS